MIQHNAKIRRLLRTRKHLAINKAMPRLSVLRTNQHIWTQIIDDNKGKTLLACSSKSLKPKEKLNKLQMSQLVGKTLAQLALKKKILHVRFDRGHYRYHGRVKALADSAREAGLKF